MERSQEAIVAYCRERGLEDPVPDEDGAYPLVVDDTIRLVLSAVDRRRVLCRSDLMPLGEGGERQSLLSRSLRAATALMAEHEAVLSYDRQRDLLFLFERLDVEAGVQQSFDDKVDDFVTQVERYGEVIKALA